MSDRMEGWYWVRTCEMNGWEPAHWDREHWFVVGDMDPRSDSDMLVIGHLVLDYATQAALVSALKGMLGAYVMEADEDGGYSERPAFKDAKALVEWVDGLRTN